jgi:hypothetical protein
MRSVSALTLSIIATTRRWAESVVATATLRLNGQLVQIWPKPVE